MAASAGAPPPRGSHSVVFIFETTRCAVPANIAAKCSALVADIISVDGTDDPQAALNALTEDLEITVPAGASPNTLPLLVEYMQLRHAKFPRPLERPLDRRLVDVIDDIDKAFVRKLDHDVALELLTVSIFINFVPLKDLIAAQLADWMVDMTVDEMRTLFGVKNDFSQEEIDSLKKEHGITDD